DQRNGMRAVAQCEERHLWTDEALFDHDPIAGRPEFPILHSTANRSMRPLAIDRDDDAFAGCETVRLHDHREPQLATRDERMRRGGVIAHAIARRGNSMPRHERLREHLARLELCCRATWAEDAKAVRCEEIDDAAIERQLGTDDSEIDPLMSREREECLYVGRADIDHARKLRDAGVARRTHDLADVAFP